MIKKCLSLLAMLCCLGALGKAQASYSTQNGHVRFSSDAPLELIKASSDKLQGALDISKNTFAFRLEPASFVGFNGALQREHFNENFLETSRHRFATFSGKIIEDIDWASPGAHAVRAKGKLHLHGVEQERIIKCLVEIAGGKVKVSSSFSILLEEHAILVPKVVRQKIASEISVEVEAVLQKHEQ